jgi:hypothetical protein
VRILVDVYDASGNRVGAGPVASASGISITRELSGAGEFSINVPGEDYLSLENLTNERRVKIWGWDTDSSPRRLLGAGIIRKVGIREDSGGRSLSVSGPDTLDELKRKQTWLGWQRNDQPIADIVDDLMALVSGWTADTSAIGSVGNLSIRLDGASVLKGLQEAAAQKGIHFRLTDDNAVEFGAFGEDSGLVITHATMIPPEMEDNDGIALIERIEFLYDSEMIANRIVVIGPGDAEAALSLKYSTRTTPYTINEMSVNDQTLYTIEAADSIAEYGAIEMVFKANNVSALSNSPADIENACNAMYDLSAAWLARYSVRQEVYKVTVRKLRYDLKPGDKVRLEYIGWAVDQFDQVVRWVKLREDFWVMGITERIGLEGASVDLQLSNVDRVAGDESQQVIGTLESLTVANTVVKPYLSKDTIGFPEKAIDNTHDVLYPLTIGDYTARLNQVLFRFSTRPFRATAQAAASGGGSSTTTASGGGSAPTSSSGGNHRHKMFAVSAGAAAYGSRKYLAITDPNTLAAMFVGIDAEFNDLDIYTYDESGTHTHSVTIPDHTHGITIPNHTHTLTYGISDDSSTPVSIRVYVDDVEVTGGPWAGSGGNQDIEIDITSMFDEIDFQGEHTVKVTCTSGQGAIEAQIEIRETIQSIRVV